MAVAEFADWSKIAAIVFLVVFVLNVLPAFAPPTWTTISFIGLTMPEANWFLVPIVAAVAATTGRIVLAKGSHALVRQKLLGDETRRNVDNIRLGIETRPALAFGTFFGYALTPLPSNYLFIAYGLTSLPIALLAAPFFVGRLVSYTFWMGTASTVSDWFDVDIDWFHSAHYFIAYYLISQLLLGPVIFAFTRFDWRVLIVEGRLKWIRK
jgi:hypothetical protein